MLRQRAKFRKLCKLVKRIFQKILRRYSRLGIDDQSRAFTVHSAHENSINLMMQSLGRQYVLYFNGSMSGQEHCGKAAISLAWCKQKINFCSSIDI
jgi:hypothetical protein